MNMHRIQVKAQGREKADVTHVYFRKNSGSNSFRYESKMFDWFAIVDVETKKIAWLPSSLLDGDKHNMHLRHTPPKIKIQEEMFHMFDDYVKMPF